MTTLYLRLKEICRDQGHEDPNGQAIAALLGVSSGRVAQIRKRREAARLGAATLATLIKLGYNPDWVQTGVGPRRTEPPAVPEAPPAPPVGGAGEVSELSAQEQRLIADFRALSPQERSSWAFVIGHLAYTAEMMRAVTGQGTATEARETPAPASRRDTAP